MPLHEFTISHTRGVEAHPSGLIRTRPVCRRKWGDNCSHTNHFNHLGPNMPLHTFTISHTRGFEAPVGKTQVVTLRDLADLTTWQKRKLSIVSS